MPTIRTSPRKLGIGASAVVLALALAVIGWVNWRPVHRSVEYRADHQTLMAVTEFGTCNTADIRPAVGNETPSNVLGFRNLLVDAGGPDARPAKYSEVAYLNAAGKILGGIYSTDNYASQPHSGYLSPDEVTGLAHTRCVTVTPNDDDEILPVWAVYPIHVHITPLALKAAPKFQTLLDGDGSEFLSGAASAKTLTVTGWPALTKTAAGVWTGIPWLPVPTH